MTRSKKLIALAVFLPLASYTAMPQSAETPSVFSWTRNSGTYKWEDSSNWSPNTAYPDGAGVTADFTRPVYDHKITNIVDSAQITIGTLKIGGTPGVIYGWKPGAIFSVATTNNTRFVFDNSGSEALFEAADFYGCKTFFYPDIIFAGSMRILNNSKYESSIYGGISPDGSAGVQSLNVAGSGPISIYGDIADSAPGGILSLHKSGAGTLTLGGQNTFTGGMSIDSGTVIDESASGSALGSANVPLEVSMEFPQTEAAAEIRFSNTSGSDASLTPPALRFSGVFSPMTISLDDAAGSGMTVRFPYWTRENNASAVITPVQADALGDSSRIFFDAAPATDSQGNLPPWIFISGNGGDFAAYDGELGVHRASYAGGGSPAYIGANTSITESASCSALKLGANLDLAGNILSMNGENSGIILGKNTKITDSAGGGLIEYGNSSLYIFADEGSSASLKVLLSGTGKVFQLGSGTVSYSGDLLPSSGLNMQSGMASVSFMSDSQLRTSVYGLGALLLTGNSVSNTVDIKDADWTTGRLFLENGRYVLSGGKITNAGKLELGPYFSSMSRKASARLELLDGAILRQSGNGVITIGQTDIGGDFHAYSNAVLVAGTSTSTGEPSALECGGNDIRIGTIGNNAKKARWNSLIVEDGGVVTNAGSISLAYSQGGDLGTMIIRGGGKVYSDGNAGIGGGYGVANGGGNTNRVYVTGEGSFWSVGNRLYVGTTGGGNTAIGNSLTISDGAVVTNVSIVGVGFKLAGSGSAVKNNSLVIENGGKLYSSGEIRIGSGYTAAASSNTAVISGQGSLWDAGGATLYINYGNQGEAYYNSLVLTNGAVVSNVSGIYVGYPHASQAHCGSMYILDGSILRSGSGNVVIGRGTGPNQPNPSNTNIVRIAGGPLGDSAWTLESADVMVGYSASATAKCSATNNVLRVERGGHITGVKNLKIGNRPGYTGLNALELAGGSVSAVSMTVSQGNMISVDLGPDGIEPVTLSGSAVFEEDTYVAPRFHDGDNCGTYTLVSAAAIEGGENLRLLPGTDEGLWTLVVSSTEVKLRKSTHTTLIIVK